MSQNSTTPGTSSTASIRTILQLTMTTNDSAHINLSGDHNPLAPTNDEATSPTDPSSVATRRIISATYRTRKDFPKIELPVYDDTYYDPDDYLREVEAEFDLYEYGLQERRMLLGRAMKKGMKKLKSWYANEGVEYQGYEELKDAFREAFEVTGRAAVMETGERLKKVKQGRDDVRTYAATFGQKLRRHQHARASAGYPAQDELSAVDQWCDGLSSEGMKEYVLLQEPATWLRAKTLSLEYEKKIYKKSEKYKGLQKTVTITDSTVEVEDEKPSSESSESSSSEEEKKTKEKKAKKEKKTVTVKTARAVSPVLTTRSLNDFKKTVTTESQSLLQKQKDMESKMDEITKGLADLTIRLGESRNMLATQDARGSNNRGNQFNMSEMTCYRCQQKGHISRGCTNPVKCARCMKGHATRDHDSTQNIMMLKKEEELEKLKRKINEWEDEKRKDFP